MHSNNRRHHLISIFIVPSVCYRASEVSDVCAPRASTCDPDAASTANYNAARSAHRIQTSDKTHYSWLHRHACREAFSARATNILRRPMISFSCSPVCKLLLRVQPVCILFSRISVCPSAAVLLFRKVN